MCVCVSACIYYAFHYIVSFVRKDYLTVFSKFLFTKFLKTFLLILTVDARQWVVAVCPETLKNVGRQVCVSGGVSVGAPLWSSQAMKDLHGLLWSS